MYMHKYHKYKTKYLELQDELQGGDGSGEKRRSIPPPPSYPPPPPPRPPRPTMVRGDANHGRGNRDLTKRNAKRFSDEELASVRDAMQSGQSEQSEQRARQHREGMMFSDKDLELIRMGADPSRVRPGSSTESRTETRPDPSIETAESAEPSGDGSAQIKGKDEEVEKQKKQLIGLFNELSMKTANFIDSIDCCANSLENAKQTKKIDDEQRAFYSGFIDVLRAANKGLKEIYDKHDPQNETEIGNMNLTTVNLNAHLNKHYATMMFEIIGIINSVIDQLRYLVNNDKSYYKLTFVYAKRNQKNECQRMSESMRDCVAISVGAQGALRFKMLFEDIVKRVPNGIKVDVAENLLKSFELASKRFDDVMGDVAELNNYDVRIDQGTRFKRASVSKEMDAATKKRLEERLTSAVDDIKREFDIQGIQIDPTTLGSIDTGTNTIMRIIQDL